MVKSRRFPHRMMFGFERNRKDSVGTCGAFIFMIDISGTANHQDDFKNWQITISIPVWL
jgi:hypothetical protein